MFDLKKFDFNWATLTAYGRCHHEAAWGKSNQKTSGIIKKMEIYLHIVDTQVPVLLELRNLRQMGILSKNPKVCIETVDLHIHTSSIAQWSKRGESGQPEWRTGEASPEVPKVGDTHSAPAGDSQVQDILHNLVAVQINNFISERQEDAEHDVED